MTEIFVTLEEAAELENISYKGMSSRLQRNPQSYKTKNEPGINGGKDRVLVALSSLSKKARRGHKEQKNIDGRDVVNDQNISENAPWYIDIDLNWYIEKFKKQYYKAVELGRQIQEFLDYNEGDRTTYADEYAEQLGISQRTLYRYSQAYLEATAWAIKRQKEDGHNYDFFKVLSLCRKPKQCFTFPSLSGEVKAFIENVWFDKTFAANNGTVEMLYEKLEEVAELRSWEYPSYQTVTRYINYLMNEARAKNAHLLASKGSKEYKNRVMIKGTRNTKALPVMGLVQGDEHTFDCWVAYTHPNGKVKAIKPKLVAWVDTRSRVIIGDVICVNANSQILKQSLLKMLYSDPGGVPQWLLIDNGKDYTSKTMTGRSRKERYNIDLSFDSETKGFYRSIGIEDDFRSIPYQPWSKGQIERFFGTVCDRFTKWVTSYTGTLTGSLTDAKVKKDVNGMLERGELLTMEDFYKEWSKWLHEKYHQRKHRSLKEQKEIYQKPMELFMNAEEKYYKPAPPKSYATMLMMKAERVHVYNIGIKRFGYEYRSQELGDYVGEKVDIKYDPEDVTKLYVYTTKGEKICEAVAQELLMIAPRVPQKALEEHIKMQNTQFKTDRLRNDYYTTPYGLREDLEQRIEGHVNADCDVVGIESFYIKGQGKESNVVTLPQDKQYVKDIKNKKIKVQQETDNEFFNKKAQSALNKLRELG